MFTLTAVVWILTNGIGDPIKGGVIRHQDAFASRAECEAKGAEDTSMIAQMAAESISQAGKQDTVHEVEILCTANGQAI